MRQEIYTLHEVADLLKMHVETIRRAARVGELKAAAPGVGKRGKGTDMRVSRIELARWWSSRGGGQLFDDVTIEESEGDPC